MVSWISCDAGGLGHRLHAVDGLADDLGQLHWAEGEGLAAALDALQVENVVDEADQAVGVGEGDAEQVAGLVVDFAENAGGEQAQRSADGGERCAQLVADGGDELVLQAVEGIALADVAEAEHGTGEAALIEDGSEDVLGWEGAAVAAEDGVFAGGGYMVRRGAAQGAIRSALVVGRRRAVQQIVDRLAGEAGDRRRPADGRRRDWRKLTMPWRSTPQMPSATESSRISCWR